MVKVIKSKSQLKTNKENYSKDIQPPEDDVNAQIISASSIIECFIPYIQPSGIIDEVSILTQHKRYKLRTIQQ